DPEPSGAGHRRRAPGGDRAQRARRDCRCAELRPAGTAASRARGGGGQGARPRVRHVGDHCNRTPPGRAWRAHLVLLRRGMPRSVHERSAALRRRRAGWVTGVSEPIRAVQEAMARDGYIAEPAIATAVYLAREMRKPLLIEGDAGVGKTEIGKVMA